jgi:DNA-binding response OmpR family regulator
MAAVLIVDSSSAQSEPYVASLRDSGFEVLVVPTAEQACTAADDLCPEIVLAHVHRGESAARGVEITKYLRAHSEIDDIPVVLMTGSLDQSDATEVAAAGCDRYLRVPIAPDRLVREIRQVLEHARRLRERSASVLARASRLQEKSEALLAKSGSLRGGATVVTTDKFGNVVRLDPEAAKLLNVSVRGGVGRNLLVFVGGERDRIARGLAQASSGISTSHRASLRPRERKALSVAIEMSANEESTGDVDWTIRRD